MNEPEWIKPADFPDDLSGWAGFVYAITDCVTGKSYIGKKNFYLKRAKKRVPSRWERYWGSCEPLLIDLKAFGKDRFERRILSIHRTAFVLNYEEVAEQIRRDVLRARLDDGSPAFYNTNVNGKWFARHFEQWATTK